MRTDMYKILILSVVFVSVSAVDVDSRRQKIVQNNESTHQKIDEVAEESKGDPVVSEGPVVYDAFFGRPLTVKRQNFLANVLNNSAWVQHIFNMLWLFFCNNEFMLFFLQFVNIRCIVYNGDDAYEFWTKNRQKFLEFAIYFLNHDSI